MSNTMDVLYKMHDELTDKKLLKTINLEEENLLEKVRNILDLFNDLQLYDLCDVNKYNHISFVDLHIFIPRGNKKYAIEKVKKLLDIYDEYDYQLDKLEMKIMSDEEKEDTVRFLNSIKKQKEAEVGTFTKDKKV